MRALLVALMTGLALSACSPVVVDESEDEEEPCDDPALVAPDCEPIEEEPRARPELPDLPDASPSCRPTTYVAAVELAPGEYAPIEVYCPAGVAAAGDCAPAGPGLIAAGLLEEEDGDYVGYRCEARNDSPDMVRVQTAMVTCCAR